MKAIIYRDNGGPDVLELLDREPAAPGPGEVRVRVAVSGVNPTDWKTRSGATNPKLYAEVTPGLDGAGVIDGGGPRGPPRTGGRRRDRRGRPRRGPEPGRPGGVAVPGRRRPSIRHRRRVRG